MDQTTMLELAEKFLAAWESQNVERVLGCYTEDLVYTDPNTRGAVRGREAMQRYLTKLFAAWTMTWSLRDAHLFDDRQGCSVLWRATFRSAAGGPTVEADGMDRVLMRGELICHNDVYFDRSVLATTQDADKEALKQLLLRGWMTHDAMWFKSALEAYGIEAANQLNRAAIRSMAPIEVKRVKQALGLDGVRSFDALQTFMTGAMHLLGGDFMRYRWTWSPPDALHVEVDRCFAHDGIRRIGAIERYECGIFDRIYAWFDALGVEHRATPSVDHCTMAREGTCVRDLRFSFDDSENTERPEDRSVF